MAYQNQIKVEITTGAGFTATADDSVTFGVGSSAWATLQAQCDVQIMGDGEITFIPFHAVDHAIVTITRTEVEDPEDPTCVTDGGDETPEP